MKVEILTPEKKLYSGEANLVKVPGTKGSFEILKKHAPLVSTLEKGQIKILDQKNEPVFFDISSGVIEVHKDLVTILAIL
ncbi:MAG: ATP synthase F1 subunit epsilon [Bacteroidetes bacterium RBG_13_42_15]|nr:MAG: ATP synthase F1 subunit epsilon [Bacteroidetes bacterium RBG_13_42_15]